MNIFAKAIASIALLSVITPNTASADTDLTPGRRNAFVSRYEMVLDFSPLTAVISKGKRRHVLKATVMVESSYFDYTSSEAALVEANVLLRLANGELLQFEADAIAGQECLGVTACAVTYSTFIDLEYVQSLFPGQVKSQPLTVEIYPRAAQGIGTALIGDVTAVVEMVKN